MNIDLLSHSSFAAGQPHEQFRWLRDHAPVYRHEEPDGPGFWAVTRFADVWAVDRDFVRFSSEPTIMIQDPAPDEGVSLGPYKMMLMMDPPEHTQLRKLIRSEFTEPSARLRRERLETLATQIVDAVIDRGACDFVSEVAGEMPSYVIAELMGLPLDDGRELYTLTEIIHTAPDAAPLGAGRAAVINMFEYGQSVIAQKRARPGDDLASKLLVCELDGRRLTDPEFLLFFLLLVDAGGDTTRNLLSGGLLALIAHPEQHDWLMQDLPTRLTPARDEFLRWVSPVVYMRRTATEDVELGGQPVRKGDKVVMYFGSANRDPEKFERPEILDLGRTPNEQLAFGTGPHGCLGQHLARLEIDCMLREVLTRMTDFELAAPVEWLASSFISGPKTMPVRFRRR